DVGKDRIGPTKREYRSLAEENAFLDVDAVRAEKRSQHAERDKPECQPNRRDEQTPAECWPDSFRGGIDSPLLVPCACAVLLDDLKRVRPQLAADKSGESRRQNNDWKRQLEEEDARKCQCCNGNHHSVLKHLLSNP